MRDGGSCDGVQIQGWLVGFAAIFGWPATSLETKLYPHAPYGDRKGEWGGLRLVPFLATLVALHLTPVSE